MNLTAPQIRAARALLAWSIDDLAACANVHRNTVLRAEKGTASASTLAALQIALEKAGVIFILDQNYGEGVRLNMPSKNINIVHRSRKTKYIYDISKSGFRRFSIYKDAMCPRDLRAILDPQSEDLSFKEKVYKDLHKIQRENINKIDKLSREIKLIDVGYMKSRSKEELAFACALDHSDPKERMYAMIARAYARADRFAAACADEIDIRKSAPALSDSLGKTIEILSGPEGILWHKNRVGDRLYEGSTAGRALSAYERMIECEDRERTARYEDLRFGLKVIETVRDRLELLQGKNVKGQDGTGPNFGWPGSDEPRYFFLLRLAEVFSMSTGEVPTFYWSNRLPDTNWFKFSRSALIIAGLDINNFDDLSRRIGGRRPELRRNEFEAHYAHMMKCISEWFNSDYNDETGYRSSEKCAGDLMTCGLSIDRQDGGEPFSWRCHLFSAWT